MVIDRLAVTRLFRNTEPVREALKAYAHEALEAQEKLYAPLRQAFEGVWPEKQKMQKFWALCERCVEEGRLVAGWNEARTGDDFKSLGAAKAAKHYETRLKRSTTLQQPKPD
ncbi:MAG: hypothetical protein K8R48_01580 [Alphaproteobacteria bacterium]|nr:hypothetical protein [Alphaproteobacteria bacterium]